MPAEGYERRFPYPARASGWTIVMRDKEWKVFQDDIPIRSKVRLRLVADDYCSDGPNDLDNTTFRFLGHHAYRGVSIRMEEFKAPQVRLFGFLANANGVRTFFVTGMDAAKKQQKVNKTKLTAAVKEAVKVMKLLG